MGSSIRDRRRSSLLTTALGLLAVACGQIAAADQWKFLVYSDSNGNFGLLPEFANQTVLEDPALVLFPGDLSSGGYESQFDSWRSAMAPVYEHGIAVCAVTGNHDAYSGQSGLDAFKSKFITPLATNPFSGCRDFTVSTDPSEDRSYSFAYRNATFLGLDTHANANYSYDRVNQAFVDQRLARSNLADSPLVFAFWHEPAFRVTTSGIACLSAYPAERNTLWRSLENAGCREVFNGHYHQYADARLDNGDGNPDNDIHQIVAGSCSYFYPSGYNGDTGPWTVVPVATETNFNGYVRVVVDDAARTVTQTWVHRTTAGAFQETPYTWTYSYAPPPARIWRGSGADDDWATPANWDGTVPRASSPLVFSGAKRLAANNDLAADTIFYGLTFAADAGAFTLDGNRIRLVGSIVNDSSNDQAINLPVMLGRNCTIDVGERNMVVGGVLSGDAGGLTKAGDGTLTLTAMNTYAGPTTVSAGTLVAGSVGAVPKGGDVVIGAGARFVLARGVINTADASGLPANAVASASPVPEPGNLGLVLTAALMGLLAVAARQGAMRRGCYPRRAANAHRGLASFGPLPTQQYRPPR
jgi:autotransporter-associated beta strand protein